MTSRLSTLAFTISGSISFIITSLITSTLICSLYCNRRGPLIDNQWYKIPSVLAAIFYCLSTIVYILMSFYLDDLQDSNTKMNHIANISFSIFTTLLFLAHFSISITFLSRLYWTFIDSIHRISKCLLRFMILLLIVFILTVIYWNILLYINWYNMFDIFTHYQIDFQIMIVLIVLLCCDMLFGVIMLYLFVKKLFSIITERKQTIINVTPDKKKRKKRRKKPTYTKTISSGGKTIQSLTIQSSESNSQPIVSEQISINTINTIATIGIFPPVPANYIAMEDEKNSKKTPRTTTTTTTSSRYKCGGSSGVLNENDMIILDLMTKYTILNILTVFVSQIGFILFSMLGIMHAAHECCGLGFGQHDSGYFMETALRNIIIVCLFPVDCIVNCMVLILNFRFSHRLYIKLCGSIHRCVQVKYAKRAAKSKIAYSRRTITPASNVPASNVLTKLTVSDEL